MKMPKGTGLWPAFWMLPTAQLYGGEYGGWAASGEIDIMEYRGDKVNRTTAAIHYQKQWPYNTHMHEKQEQKNVDYSADFHVYALDWTADSMTWSVDEEVFYKLDLNRDWFAEYTDEWGKMMTPSWMGEYVNGSVKSPYTANRQPWDKPFGFTMNMAVGGVYTDGIDAKTWLKNADGARYGDFQVDYVRVFQAEKNPVVSLPGIIDVGRVISSEAVYRVTFESTSPVGGNSLYEVAIRYKSKATVQKVMLTVCDGAISKEIGLGGRQQKYVEMNEWETEYVTVTLGSCPWDLMKLTLSAVGDSVEVASIEFSKFKVTWEDNFDGTSLDSKKWEYEIVSFIIGYLYSFHIKSAQISEQGNS